MGNQQDLGKSNEHGIRKPVPPLTCCVILREQLNLSESQYPHKDDNLYPGLIGGSDEIMDMKRFVTGNIRQMRGVNACFLCFF